MWYQVDITRDVVEHCVLKIEAASEGEAIAKAKIKVMHHKLPWERGSIEHTDFDAWELTSYDE